MLVSQHTHMSVDAMSTTTESPTYGDGRLAWILGMYRENLIVRVCLSPLAGATPNDPRRSYRVSLAEMQRLHIQRLQFKLAAHAKRLYEGSGGMDWDDWEKDLQRYIQALQEHDYMERRGGEMRDPFLISGERKADRDVLDKTMGGIQLEDARKPISVLRWEKKGISPVSTRSQGRFEKLIVRMGVAVVGAAFMIGPMWLIILTLDTLEALWTTTIFVTVFGLMMAFVLQDNITVLTATAAYAAVLVVFVASVAEAYSF